MSLTHIAASDAGRAGIALVRDWLAANAPGPGTPLSERRARHEAFAAAAPAVEGVSVSAGSLGGVRTLVVTPPEARGDVLVLHGGAYVLGSPESHLPLVARCALASGARMHALAWSLAPEHPCPAGIEDTLAAWRALSEEAPRAAMLGNSAGGGIALAAVVAARAAGLPQPSLVAMMGPWVDLSVTRPSTARNAAADVMLDVRGLQADAALYRGARPVEDALVSPLNADLSGLAPIFVQVGGDEILLDDALELERRVSAAGGRCDVEVWEGMTHSWAAFDRFVPEANAAIQALGRRLRAALDD
jgi:acetyl esterase/lipase